jgi:hypothetical protein
MTPIRQLREATQTEAVRYARTLVRPALRWVLLAWTFMAVAQRSPGSWVDALAWVSCTLAFIFAYGAARALITNEVPEDFANDEARLAARMELLSVQFELAEAERAFAMADWPPGTRLHATGGWVRREGTLRKLVHVDSGDAAEVGRDRTAEFIVRFDEAGELTGYELKWLR